MDVKTLFETKPKNAYFSLAPLVIFLEFLLAPLSKIISTPIKISKSNRYKVKVIVIRVAPLLNFQK